MPVSMAAVCRKDALRSTSGTSPSLFIVLLSVWGLSCSPVFAASTADINAAERQAERLQQDINQRIQQQRLQDLQSDQPPTRLEIIPAPRPQRESASCRDIDTVEISGVTLLRASIVRDLQERYQGRCLGVAEIEQLMSDLTWAYMSRGYVSARAYLPGQDLTQGKLTLMVSEGQLEAVDVEDGDKGSISVEMVFPGDEGEPLNLRDLEQALDQINRLASNNASMEILPGSKPGDSRVVFYNQPTRPYHLSVTFDNSGQKSTGRNQLGVSLGLDSPLGLNDYLGFTHRRAQPYESGKQASYFNNLTYVLPWGYNTFSLSLSDSEYASLLDAPSGSTLRTRGDSQTYTFTLDRVLWRGQSSQWNVSGSITQKEQGNYLEDTFLAVSSRRLTVVELDTSYTLQVLGGALTATAGIARGVPWFNSVKDPANLPSWAPRAQFEKYKYGLSYFKPFEVLGKPLTFNSQINGQQSVDVLYGSERISIGSPYTVRGFNEESISGDNGYYWRNELSLSHFAQLPSGHTVLLRPFIGLDYGEVRNRKEDHPGEMSSASVGLAVMVGMVSLNLTATSPIKSPEHTTDQGDTLAVNLSISL